ncbi:hypothetical protein EROM_060060 [Encephalitozoon romaleae SJ-2008]|uniref:Uncharacterized protein n=1 Tax=Encephalitozoon romaleae (strain SJ-2008) TaxID=1178016 RepID=I6ZTV2_ENCRO|nr:hypothetical protein EROM_060060 [Encephalitozoon romaleae SJ-2008]AFN83101.1 hypothetical protein EROM_060060 [Encephalitozoon romaleae SJ-2008]
MKPEVGDVDEVMEQIARLAPPSQKEDHKFLNLLRKAIEKNTIVTPGPSLEKLAEKTEQRDFKVLSLALLRKDLPVKAREEFNEHIRRVKEKIEGLRKIGAQKEGVIDYEKRVERPNRIIEEINRIEESVPDVQKKIKKARDLIEEVFSKSSGRHLRPLEYAENFFKLI